jgi:quercetin dioxygenase-like cupin family protein
MATELDELAALDAVGALDESERETLRRLREAATPEERQAAARVYEVAEALARLASSPSLSRGPSSALRDRLMTRVSRPGSFSVFAANVPWLPTPFDGIQMKVLSHDQGRNSAVLYLQARAGARYPPHHHGGTEECYVLSGDVRVDANVLHAGDFHHAEAGSDHGELWTQDGAEVLLVVTASDYGLQ